MLEKFEDPIWILPQLPIPLNIEGLPLRLLMGYWFCWALAVLWLLRKKSFWRMVNWTLLSYWLAMALLHGLIFRLVGYKFVPDM